jgi:hypothetical protein
MKIGENAYTRQLVELTPVPLDQMVHHAVDLESPCIEIDSGRPARVQNRPFLCSRLTRRNPLDRQVSGLIIEPDGASPGSAISFGWSLLLSPLSIRKRTPETVCVPSIIRHQTLTPARHKPCYVFLYPTQREEAMCSQPFPVYHRRKFRRAECDLHESR